MNFSELCEITSRSPTSIEFVSERSLLAVRNSNTVLFSGVSLFIAPDGCLLILSASLRTAASSPPRRIARNDFSEANSMLVRVREVIRRHKTRNILSEHHNFN